MNLKNCKLIIKDPLLSKQIGNKFDNIEDFKKALKKALLIDKKAIPVSLDFQGQKGVAKKLKFLQVIDTENGLEVQVTLPNLELGKNLKGLVKGARVSKYSIVIPDINTELGKASDLDTLAILFLGNYFLPDASNIKSVLENQVPKVLEAKGEAGSKFLNSVIGDDGIIDYYLSIAKDFNVEINPDVVKAISQKRASLSIGFEPVLIENFKDYEEKEEKEKMAPEPTTKPHSSKGLLFKTFSTSTDELDVARQALILGLEGETRIKVVRSSNDFVQPLNKGVPLTSAQVNSGKGIVAIIEKKENGVWKPVYLKSKPKIFEAGKLTTDKSEAYIFDYKIDATNLRSSQLYLSVPSQKRAEFEQLLTDGKEITFRIEATSVDSEYKSFKDRGVTLDQIFIPDKEAPFGVRGVPELRGPKGIELISIGTLTDGEDLHKEVLGLMEGDYKSFSEVSKVISYLNEILMLGEFTTPKDVQTYEEALTKGIRITSRGIGFYPYKEGDNFKIEYSVERYKSEGGYVTEPNQTPVRTITPKVKLALLGQRIRVPKTFEGNSVGNYTTRLYYENGIKEKSWPKAEQEEYLLGKLSTRLTQVNGKLGYAENYVFTYDRDRLEVSDIQEVIDFSVGVTPVSSIVGGPLSEQGELVYSLLKEGKSVNFLSDSEMNKLGTDLIAAYTNGQIYLRASQITKENVKGYVLEELIHAYTADNLESQKDTVEYQELDRLRKHIQDNSGDDKVQYYTASMEEFVTSLTMPFMQDLIKNSGFVYETTSNQGVYEYILSLLNELMSKIASLFYENPSIQEQVTFDLLKLIFNRASKVQQFTESVPPEIGKKRTLVSKKKILGSFDRVPEVPVAHLDMLLSNLAWDIGQFADLLNGDLDAELVKEVLLEELEEESKDPARAEYLKPFLKDFDATFETWLKSSKLAELEVKDKTQSDTDTKFQDRTESSISSVDAGTKYARVFIKMIPKILLEDGEPVMDNGQYVYAKDKNGNLIPSDYTTLWNSIADAVHGSLDIEEIKEKLKGYKKLPEMNIVLERLEQLTGTGDSAYEEMFILKGIEQSFSKVLVPTIIVKQKVEAKYSDDFLEKEDFVDPEFGSGDEEFLRSTTYDIFESGRLDAQNIKSAMLDSFKAFADKEFEELTPTALLEYLNKELKPAGNGYTDLSIKKVMKHFGVNITSQMESYPTVRNEVYSVSSNFLVKLVNKLEYVKNTELEITFDIFDFLENAQEIDGKKFIGYKGVVLNFQNTMSKYLPYSTSNMTKNPEGKNQSNLHNFSSYLLNIKFINEGKYDRVERLRNPIAKYSLALNAVRGGAKIMPLNVSGTEFVDRGTNTISLGTIEYVRQELITVLEGGFKENLRAETASSSFGYRIPFNKSSTASGTYLPLSKTNTLEEAKLQFKQYLKGELERVWLERNAPTKYGSRFYESKKAGLTFFSFLDDTFLTDLDLISVEQIDQFVEERETEFYEQFENYFSEQKQDFKNWIQAETGQVLDAKHPVFLSQLKEQAEEDLEGLLDTFLLNSLILSIEEIILFHGELGQFDKIYKRLKSNISNGTPFVLSGAAQVIFKERLQGGTFSEVYGVRPEYYNDTTKMKSIVLKEAKMKASPEQIENLVEGAKNSLKMTDEFFGRTPENLEERAAEVVAPYGDSSKEGGPSSDISDGEGWVFPDAYRIMCQAVNSWGKEKEEGFQYLAIKFKKKKGFIITEREQLLFEEVENNIKEKGWYFQFPKLKFQYRGSARPINGTTNVAVELLDKFALTPIFPEFIEGTIAEQHFEQMAKQGIAYGKFQSGTKLGTFTPDDWQVVKEYESTHEIDTVYLKEQVKTPDYIKTENLMGSQKRKLVLSNISLNGEFMNSLKSAVGNWIEGQRELAESARETLMKDLGAEDGQVDVYKVVELIKEELESRDLPLAYTELFENYSGQNLEESLSPQSVETLIYSLLKNRIVKAKFPGGQLVQVAPALFGAEEMEFYRYENGEVLPADCMVTLSGDFLNLLNLPEVTNNTLEELNELLKDKAFRKKYKKELTLSAYRIPTQGLNSMDIFMVKRFLPQWMGNTIVPPPQIVTKSGTDYDYDKESVILPSIGKNGRYIREAREEYLEEKYRALYNDLMSQIDIIKSDPFFKILGFLSEQSKFNVNEELIDIVKSRLVKDGEIISVEDFIQAAKDSVFKQVKHNKVLEASKDIVLNPANFHRLITPNTDAIIKGAVEEVTAKLYPGVGKVNAEPQLSKVFSYTTHLKKWKAVKIKDLLGIGAVANTFYTLMQTVDFKLNSFLTINEVGFEFNVPLLTEEEQKLVKISDPFIIDKEKTTLDKLEIINQFINITVDAASNDIAGYTNLISDNTGFVMFQTMLGVPLPRILKLLHQPEIYAYHQKINVLVGKGYSRGEAKKEAMLELLGIDPVIVTQDGTFPKSNKKIWEDIKRIGYSNPLNLREIQPLGSKSTFNKEVLVYYLVGLAQADALRKVQSKNNFDTSTNPSYKMSNIQEENPDVEVDGLFNLESSDKIHNDSVISHLNVHEEFKQISEVAFGIKNYKPYVDFVTSKASNIFTSKGREKFVRVIDNDFLMAIIQNFGTQDLVEIQNLMAGPLMDTWATLKEKYPELNDTVLGSKLIADRYEDFVNPMYFVGLDNDTSTYNTLAQDIQNLLEGTLDQAQFAKDLVKVAFFQSGFNQSKLYMLKGIPPNLVTGITSEAYTAFENLSSEDKKQFIGKFWNKFLQNRVLEFGKSFPKEYSGEVNFVKAMFDKRNFRFMKYQFDFNEQVQETKNNFQGFVGGFENTGKGTPQGDGKDIAMRKVATTSIVELDNDAPSSSKTTQDALPWDSNKAIGGVVMLARNGKLSGSALNFKTKERIFEAFERGATFVVGDMPNVDSQFIDYLKEIGASFKVYHTGSKSRIAVEMTPTQTQPVSNFTEKINIYAGTNENAELSNFAKRPFITDGKEFSTVEGAFQAEKAKYAELSVKDYDKVIQQLKTVTGAEAKLIGRKLNITPEEIKEWDKVSSEIMKKLVKESFEQNLEALNILLATGNAELTHTQDKSKWGKEFPKLLMEVRQELQPIVSETTQVFSTDYTEHTLYSGDAIGADKLWAAQSKEFGVGKTVNYKVNTLKSLTKAQQDEVESAYLKAKDDLGRKTLSYNWTNPQKEDYVGGLVRRDYLQAKAADAIFAISDIIGVGEKGKPVKGTRYTSKSSKEIVDGGTGYAVQMAINLGKPVYVFHQGTNTDNKASVGWYKWDYNMEKFVPVPTPVLTKNFAGIGTREINDLGKQAIKDVYQKTINSQKEEVIEQPIQNKEVKGIEINSYQKGLGKDLTNVHYAKNGKSEFDIIPTDKSLILTKTAKDTWGSSVEAWYKSNQAKTKSIPEGPEGDAYDMKLMVGLISDKLKQYPSLMTRINEKGGLEFIDKSTHSMGKGSWSSANPKNMFITALKQAFQLQNAPVNTSSITNDNVVSIPQNKVSGIESYGSMVTANDNVISVLGNNPHSIDMIEAGLRTRTTRSETEMQKYGVKVGDTIKHFGKSKDGSTKTVYAVVTAIHPKGTEGWKGTWSKEGWKAENVSVIDRFKDGAAAIEFQVIDSLNTSSVKPVNTPIVEPVSMTNQDVNKNTVIFTNADGVDFYMNAGQQKAYDGLKEKILERIFKNDGQGTKAFTDPLNKEYSDVIPMNMWNNMFGLIGKGGVGKTTLANKLISDIEEEVRKRDRWQSVNTQFTAPTHNAVTILQESLGIDSETTVGVKTTAALVARNQVKGSDKGIPDAADLWLLQDDFYKQGIEEGTIKNLSSYNIIVIDEASMIGETFIKDVLRRLKTEGDTRMPIFLFMGDYRQLPPIEGDNQNINSFKEGIISATLFSDPSKFYELTEVMRTKDQFFHQIFNSVGDQITQQRIDFNAGNPVTPFSFTEYDQITSKSTENLLVVNESQVDALIDDYTDFLMKNDNPYEIFWVHFNKVANQKTKDMSKRIRKKYFEKVGKPLTEEIQEGDFIILNSNRGMETSQSRDGSIKSGYIKPTTRLKVQKITYEKAKLADFSVLLELYLPDIEIDVKHTVVYNRQGKQRLIKTLPEGLVKIGKYNTDTKMQEITIKTATGDPKILQIHWSKYKEIKGIFESMSVTFDKLFSPSYIGSSHTVQGASYKSIIVGDYNIRENVPHVSMKSYSSSLYTSLTRTSGKLVIIKPNAIKVEPNQNVFSWGPKIETPFTTAQMQTIVSNFASKHKMSETEAQNYVNEALASDKRESVLETLKNCYL